MSIFEILSMQKFFPAENAEDTERKKEPMVLENSQPGIFSANSVFSSE